jgi:two-component system, cell cycle response regulator
MNEKGPQRERTIDPEREKRQELRKIRREQIMVQYRATHSKFNQHVIEHQLSDEQAYELLFDIMQDPKTGVQRDDLLEYALKTDISFANNFNQPLSMAVFDIDNFKEINTELTHVGGDDVLREVAKRLRTSDEMLPGDGDSVVRWGGEEFVVVFNGLNAFEAQNAAEHIRVRIAEALANIRPSGKQVTVSGGVAQYNSERHQDWKELLGAADAQVMLAKESGKNVIFPLPEKKSAS